MGKTAQGAAFFGGAGFVVGVNLDDVALAIEFIAVVVAAVGADAEFAVVPAHVFVVAAAAFPAVAGQCTLGAAITVERGDALVIVAGRVVGGAAGKVAGPVFFTGQKASPWRFAGAAIVQCAAGARAVGRILGHHHCIAAHRASHLNVGQRCQAEVEGRVIDIGPLVGGLLDFNHRDAMDRNFLVHFCGRAGQGGGASSGVQEEGTAGLVGRRFVVDRQQAAVGRGQRWTAGGTQAIPLHAVVVVARPVFEVAVAAVVLERAGTAQDGISQRVDDACGVARRHGHFVGQVLGHCAKAQRSCCCRGCSGYGVAASTATSGEHCAAQYGSADRRHAAHQQTTAAQPALQHAVERGVVRGVGVFVVEIVQCAHRIILGLFGKAMSNDRDAS